MKKIVYVLLLGGIFTSCRDTNKPASSADDAIKKMETSLVSRVYFEGDSLWTIEERMKHYGIPGVSIAVIHDNKIEFLKTYGVMDKESKTPVTPQTLFQAASVSKPVSAYAALRLVEQSKLDINENVNTYLKSWKLPDNEFTKDKKVSIKELLSHTGGVTVHGFWGYSPDLPVPTLLQVLDGKAPANSPPIRVDKVPGGDFRYSGGGYCILQQLMIDNTGKPFPQIMTDFVFHPLGMTNSTFNQPLQGEQLKRAATGYVPDGSQTKGKRHTYPEMAPAGLWTTAEDLAKFAIDVQQTYKGESNKVISKQLVTAMLTPVTEDHYALGFGIIEKNGDVYFAHNGWNEGFCSELTAHKEKGYGVVVLINANQPEFKSEVVRAVAMTYKWDNYFPIHKKMNFDATELAGIAGRYYFHKNHKRIFIELTQKGNKLYKKNFSADSIELFKIAANTYIGSDNDLIQFQKGAKGNAFDSLVVHPRSDSQISFTFWRMKNGEKLPYEFLVDGQFEKALADYRRMKAEDPQDEIIQEDNLIQMGYLALSTNKIKLAKDIFKISTLLYPLGANTYDSYAEACMKNNETDLAIENYKIALKLDPKNSNAVKMLAELQKKKASK